MPGWDLRRCLPLVAAGLTAAVLATACSPGSSLQTAPKPGDPSPLVDPADIVPGGPPPDGIPPIDRPKFVDASTVRFLAPQEPVIALKLNGDVRAYPAQIMIWHEIVNDTAGGVPVSVTYCPLCNTGIAFERPVIRGRLLDFGTSGKLYNSNLVMYDRQTKSLWPQALGEAVIGPLTGTKLELVPVQMVSWSDWLAAHPHGRVLSRDTGFDRAYGENPYEGYDRPNSPAFLFHGPVDPRLPPKARIVGVQIGTAALAIPYERLRARSVGGWARAAANLRGTPLVVFWRAGTVSAVDAGRIRDSHDVGAMGVFDARLDGRTLSLHPTPSGPVDDQTGSTWDILGRAVAGPLAGESLHPVVATESFWFDWAAFHPDTAILGR